MHRDKTESFFLNDIVSDKEPILIESNIIDPADPGKCAGVIPDNVSSEALQKGEMFAKEIDENILTSFEKPGDKMVHVSTFVIINGIIYMTYYANDQTSHEDPKQQKARFAFCPADDLENKTFFDLQCIGDQCGGKEVNMVYDTIVMTMDNDTLFLMWTASLSGKYYRLYRTYTISSGELGPVQINRFKVGNIVTDFSFTGIQSALTANGIGFKSMYSDIGIMQKLSTRVENGVTYYFTGAYSGDFNFIIKSRDLVTWEYVSQPYFPNQSKWENATYVIGDKCYYFSRQHDDSPYGFLTYYDLKQETWATPVLISDCQSRSDFIVYNDNLYLFHAPIDRNHIGIIHVDLNDLSKSSVVLQAHMKSSCFYPFIQHGHGGLPYTEGTPDTLYMSYTVSRSKIPLSKFNPQHYLNK